MKRCLVAGVVTCFFITAPSWGQLLEQLPTYTGGLVSNTADGFHAAENFSVGAGNTIVSITVWSIGVGVIPEFTVVFWDDSGIAGYPGTALTPPQTVTAVPTADVSWTRHDMNLTTPFTVPGDGVFWIQVYAPTVFSWYQGTQDPVAGVPSAAAERLSDGLWLGQGIDIAIILRDTVIPVELQSFTVQ